MPSPKPLRFLLVEDQKLLRELLRSHLEHTYPGCEITEVVLLSELANITDPKRYSLSIVDLELSDGNSMEWILEWSKRPEEPRVVVLTSIQEDYVLFKTLHSNIQGFVHKSDGTEVLHEAIKAVLCGRVCFSNTVQHMRSRMTSDPAFFNKVLSEREQLTLEYLGQGLKNEDVAQILALSVSTVADYRKNIMAKLGIHSQLDLVRYAVQKGFSRI